MHTQTTRNPEKVPQGPHYSVILTPAQDAWISLGVAIALIAIPTVIDIVYFDARIASAFFPAMYASILWKGFRGTWLDRTDRMQLKNSY